MAKDSPSQEDIELNGPRSPPLQMRNNLLHDILFAGAVFAFVIFIAILCAF